MKVVLFTVTEGRFMTFLSGNRIPECDLARGYTLEGQVDSCIKQSLGLSSADGFIEQLYTISESKDAPSITVVYYMLIAPDQIPQANRRAWADVFTIKKSQIDNKLLMYAVQRLQWKIEYTNVVYSLLPLQFTLGELQRVYEAILHKSLDKRNFRKKILSLGMIKDVQKKRKLGRARPAEVYTFINRKLTIVQIL
jgi:8-oxo-dGTP diphosphatase